MNKKYSNFPIAYLANPYSHKDPAVMKQRAEAVDRAAARLLRLDIMTYPPIALNCRWTEYEKDFPHTWTFWERFDKNMVERCDWMIVLMLDGWKESVGVQSEIQYAKELGLEVCYVTYEEVMSEKIDHLLLMQQKISAAKNTQLN